ncbi:MAG TPA: glycosyltransferase [Vicinamibacterales bacterium]|nr:glycosyltransferase [Vicinamibacterales bacterium]
MKGIRLLNVVPTLLCGGTENHFMTLARSLDSARFDLQFACLRKWGPFVAELAELKIPLVEYRVATFRSLNALVQQARLARHVRQHAVQIVHTYSFYGNVFAIPPARFAAPVVIASIRDRGPYLTPMQRRVQRHVCRLADCVLVNAEAVKTWLVDDGYDPSNIVVIPNGVDLRRFAEMGNRDETRRSMGIPEGARLVGVVSRVSRLKGIEDFIDAAAMVAAKQPDVRFVVVGEPSPIHNVEYVDELAARARSLGIGDKVIFTGLRSDVPAVLGALDVSVMPSLNEALSNVLLESMAAGAAVVATDVGGTAEALTNGANGLLVQPGRPEMMAAAIEQLLATPALARRLGATARKTIQDRFSLDRMVAATEALYDHLLSAKHRTVAAA